LSGSTQLHRLLMERLGFGFEAALVGFVQLHVCRQRGNLIGGRR